MNRFDFLSGAPKTLIFEKNSNKTNLGGVFTLLFLLIVIIIIVAYIYDYCVNDKYLISYTYENIVFGLADEDKIEKRNKDINLNPMINFSIVLDDSSNPNNYELISGNNEEPIEFNKF